MERRMAPAMACSSRTASGPGTPTASNMDRIRWNAAVASAPLVAVDGSPPKEALSRPGMTVPVESGDRAAIIPCRPSASIPAGLERASL